MSLPIHENIKTKLEYFHSIHKIPNIIFNGPSGSGKTTVLRMIAGFEKPDSGTITLTGKDVSQLPPYERDVNTVFQDYALFPHMNVLANIEYGLRVKGVSRENRRKQALVALKQIRLEGYENRKPAELSGGYPLKKQLTIFPRQPYTSHLTHLIRFLKGKLRLRTT